MRTTWANMKQHVEKRCSKDELEINANKFLFVKAIIHQNVNLYRNGTVCIRNNCCERVNVTKLDILTNL